MKKGNPYQILIIFCIMRLTPVIATQQQSPVTIGLPLLLMRSTIFVLSPTAAMATTMQNLLRVLSGAKSSSDAPRVPAAVVTYFCLQPDKYRLTYIILLYLHVEAVIGIGHPARKPEPHPRQNLKDGKIRFNTYA